MDKASVTAMALASIAAISGWFTARTATKKRPEDRDSVIAETTERVVEVLDKQLEKCFQQRDLFQAQVDKLRERMLVLEREVERLGGDPRKINGGAV